MRKKRINKLPFNVFGIRRLQKIGKRGLQDTDFTD